MTRRLDDVQSLGDFLLPFELFLARREFIQVDAREDPQHFGDALRSYANGDFRIRFSRDRWVFHIDVASAARPQDWLPLNVVLRFLAQDRGELTESSRLSDPDYVIPLLESQYDALGSFLGEGGFCERRDSLQDFAKREALRNLDALRK